MREQIQTLRDQHNVKYQDIAVLYRTNLQVRVGEGIYTHVSLSAVSTRKPGILNLGGLRRGGLYIFAGWSISASLGLPLGGEDSTR